MDKKTILIILVSVVALVVVITLNQPKASDDTWTLYVYNEGGQVEDAYYEYKTLPSCWDAAVTATQRGKKYFECGRNCGDFSKTNTNCNYICPQGKLFDCEEELGLKSSNAFD